VCLAQIIKLCSRLYKSPVVVTFGTEAVNVYEVPFPAVTICPESKTERKRFSYHDNRIKFEKKQPMTDYEYNGSNTNITRFE
jgi:amiloride-sensitive sodium channel